MLGLAIWVIGEIIQSSSFSFGQFIAGRAIAGFGIALESKVSPCTIANVTTQAMASPPRRSPLSKPNA